MNRRLLFLLMIFILQPAFAKKSPSEARVHIAWSRAALKQEFWIRDDQNKNHFVILKEGKRKLQKQKLKADFADLLVRDFHSLHWEAKQRELQGKARSCTPYARLKLIGEPPLIICLQDPQSTGRMASLLYSLSENFK